MSQANLFPSRADLARALLQRDRLYLALQEVTHVPGLTDIEAAHLTAREGWHAAMNAVYRKAQAALDSMR